MTNSSDGSWSVSWTDVQEKESWHIQSAILFTFFTLAFCGNTAVIYELVRSRFKNRTSRPSSVTWLYVHLAVADLLAAFCCILSNAIMYLTQNFTGGDSFCKVLKYFQKLGLAGGTLIVVAISFDRCMAVLYPMRRLYQQYAVLALAGTAWFTAAVLSLPQVVLFGVSPKPNHHVPDVFQCAYAYLDDNGWSVYRTANDVVNLTFLYIVPIVWIATNYGLIINKIGRETKEVNRGALITPDSSISVRDHNRTALFLKARRSSIIVSAVVICTFILCWAPFYISLVIHLAKPEIGADYYFNHAIYFCGLSHSVVNPLVYGFFHAMRNPTGKKYYFFGPSMRDQNVSRTSSSYRFSNSATGSSIKLSSMPLSRATSHSSAAEQHGAHFRRSVTLWEKVPKSSRLDKIYREAS